jgi:hypothetical protein
MPASIAGVNTYNSWSLFAAEIQGQAAQFLSVEFGIAFSRFCDALKALIF